jgi:RNA polymerase sigma factor (sigma-70 family)
MDVKIIKTAKFEIEVSVEIWEIYEEYHKKQSYYKRKTKKYLSFDELMRLNEKFEEGYIAKVPIQLTEPSFENEAIATVRNEILLKAIKKLSNKQRRRIILRYYKGLTIFEIAEIEKTTFQAISKSIIKSLEKLKIFLS